LYASGYKWLESKNIQKTSGPATPTDLLFGSDVPEVILESSAINY